MITITATVTIRENDTPLVTVEHVEGRAAWGYQNHTLVYSSWTPAMSTPSAVPSADATRHISPPLSCISPIERHASPM